MSNTAQNAQLNEDIGGWQYTLVDGKPALLPVSKNAITYSSANPVPVQPNGQGQADVSPQLAAVFTENLPSSSQPYTFNDIRDKIIINLALGLPQNKFYVGPQGPGFALDESTLDLDLRYNGQSYSYQGTPIFGFPVDELLNIVNGIVGYRSIGVGEVVFVGPYDFSTQISTPLNQLLTFQYVGTDMMLTFTAQ